MDSRAGTGVALLRIPCEIVAVNTIERTVTLDAEGDPRVVLSGLTSADLVTLGRRIGEQLSLTITEPPKST
jgi:hypothetical protein